MMCQPEETLTCPSTALTSAKEATSYYKLIPHGVRKMQMGQWNLINLFSTWHIFLH